MLVLLFWFLTPGIAQLMCPSQLWETWYDCGSNVAPNQRGCCADNKCPPGCRSASWGGSPVTCTCTGCPYAKKPLLVSMSKADQWLKAHNFYRCRHDWPLFVWNTQVANNAQAWAGGCAYGHSSSYDNTPSSGENIAMGYNSPFDTTTAWYSEIDEYTPQPTGTGGCSGVCGHYTALMWKTTTALGCGQCPASKIDVCQYALGPPNYNGQTQTASNIPRTNAAVNTDAYCCNQIFAGGVATGAPTPAPPCGLDDTSWGIWPSTQSGATHTMRCPGGFTGDVKRMCGVNGVWQDVDSSGCVPVILDCPIDNGWASVAPGTLATRPCPVNMTGTNTRQCSAAGQWAQEVNTCVAIPTCSDGVQNQGETGIDCGSPCPACLVCSGINCGPRGSCVEPNPVCVCRDGYTGARCETAPPDPCASVNCGTHGACVAGKCECFAGWTGTDCNTALPATCTDGIKNQDEAGIDCGGVTAGCFPCPNYQWRATTDWLPCTKSCGSGLQTRTVDCVDTTTNGVVGVEFCGAAHTLASSQACNVDACPTYKWQAGNFGLCSSECNTGFRTRPVDCYSSAGNVIVTTGCDPASKPASQEDCNTQECTIPRWVFGTWSDCTATCGGGTQTRTVQCQNQNNTVIPEGTCEADSKPALQQTCNLDTCDSYRWKACPSFYPCTAQCNGGGAMAGVQYRDVFCVRSSDGAAVDATLCPNTTRPTSSLSVCNTQPCSNYNWMADGNWGPCEELNGVFVRRRTFHCHAADGTTTLRSNCEEKAGKLPIAVLPCTAGTCANAEGCPTVEIAEVLNSCEPSALFSCDPKSNCGRAASDLDLSFLTVGISAVSAKKCVEDYVSSLATATKPAAELLQTLITRVEGGSRVCGVGVSGVTRATPLLLAYVLWLLL